MRPVIVRRFDRAHRGSILVMDNGRYFDVPQGKPVRLPGHIVEALRDARVHEFTDRWERTVFRIYSVRQVRAS